MTTSLQRQLAALAAPSSSLLVPERRRSSIIFSPQDAAKYDRDAFYKLGLDGLHELISINPKLFEPFEDSILFKDDATRIERAVEDREFNDKLNEVINNFLTAIYPYMMIKASLKCMEWLVYRFHIERFNVDAILRCILPYYDTKTFVMVAQVLEIERFQQNREWEWMIPCIQSGAPLRRAVLFDNCNSQFIVWLFSSLNTILSVHKTQPENLRVFLAFMSSTIVGILHKFKSDLVSNPYKIRNRKFIVLNILNQIFSLLQQLQEENNSKTRSEHDEVFSMTYILMGMISVCCNEVPELHEVIGLCLSKIVYVLAAADKATSLTTESYLLLNVLLEHNNSFSWNVKRPKTLIRLLNDIADVSQQWDVSVVATRLILSNLEKNTALTPAKILDWVKEIQLTPSVRSNILRNAYYHYITVNENSALMFLTHFERQYPIEFEMIVSDDPKFATKLITAKTRPNYTMLSQDADPEKRIKGVKRLLKKAFAPAAGSRPIIKPKKGKKIKRKKCIKTRKFVLDTNPIAKALLPRFLDDSNDVVIILLKVQILRMRRIFSHKTLASAYMGALKKHLKIGRPTRVLRQSAVQLCRITAKSKCVELKNEVLNTILPLMFPASEKHLHIALAILKTRFAKENDILSRFVDLVSLEGLTAAQMREKVYEGAKTIENKSQHEIVLGKTPAQLVLACLWMSPSAIVENVIKNTPAKIVTCKNSYPITSETFCSCLKLARKKEMLPLEWILTSLSQQKLERTEDMQEIIKFVWQYAEIIENRDSCTKFLADLLKVNFESPLEQLGFWTEMLQEISYSQHLGTASQLERTKTDLCKVRTIQFIQAHLQKYSFTALKNCEKQSAKSDSENDSDVKSPKKGRKKAASAESPNNAVGETKSSSEWTMWKLFKVLLTQCVTDEERPIREISFDCLSKIKMGTKHEILIFISLLMEYRVEITTDPRHLPIAFEKCISEKDFNHLTSLIQSSLQDPHERDVDKLQLIETIHLSMEKFSKILMKLAQDIAVSSTTSPVLRKIIELLDVSCFGDSMISTCLTNQHLAKLVTKKIDKATFETYSPAIQKKVLNVMIDQSLSCTVPEIKIAIVRCVRKWAFDCSIIAHELVKCIGMERRTNGTQVSKTAKPSLVNGNGLDSQKSLQDWLARAEIILEFIQGKKRLIDKVKLVQPLFRLLKMCMEMEEQSPEYLKQLVLSSLTICCQNEEDEPSSNSKDLANFNVDAVISCLRESNNPQTHHHGLILLNYAAKVFPEQVLHGVMSLFTFMGNHMIRQDDTYSTQLIQQTVYTIIPSLVSAGKGKLNETSRLAVAAGIFRVFASAVQDIPVHRRLPIFISLVQTLQPEFAMWLFCIIVVDSALQRDKKKSNLNADLELAVNLVWSFEPTAIVTSIEKVYGFLLSLPVYKSSITSQEFDLMKSHQSELERSVLEMRQKESHKDVLVVIHYVLELMSHISAKLVEKTDTRIEYDRLIEKCLNFSKVLSGIQDDKLFRLLTHKNLEVIDKVNSALQPSDFIEVVAIILVRDDMTVKRKVMEMLNQRLLQRIEWFGDQTDLLELLPHLLKIVDTEPRSDEETTVVQTAFLSLKLMARHLAVQNPEAFIPVFKSAMNQTEHTNKLLCASALLCTGELCCLKSLILPDLKSITRAILKAFKASGKALLDEENLEDSTKSKSSAENTAAEQAPENNHQIIAIHLLCTSAVTCLNKLVEHLGPFIGVKFLKKALVAVLTIKNQYGDSEKASHKRKILEQKIGMLFKTVSTKIPIRNSLPSIREAFSSLTKDYKGLCCLIKLLQDTLAVTSKADFTIIIQSLMDSFLEDFLTYRVTVYEESSPGLVAENEIDAVEDEIINCMISGIVLKMSESNFRPLYHKIFDWTTDNKFKLITFFRLSAAAAEKLKSLFVTFAGYVINTAVNSLKTDILLTKSITRFLFHIFSNDREGFITLDRFNSLVKPLVDLVESDYVISGQLPIKEVNEVLVQLAVATNDLNRWQYLIELLSFRSNHPNKIVRLNIISTLEAAANELSKDFLTLLPPAVPFLAELMNDDDTDVESEAQKLLLKLEEIVGEPLQPYFTT